MAKNSMTTQVEKVGPTLAERWLQDNYESNRALRWDWVLQLSERIKNGTWKLTHQGCAFDEDGKLIDGQHRLWAIVESGLTVELNVSRNVPRESFHYLDQHKVRSISDLAGDKWVTPKVVATARAVLRGPIQNHYGTVDDRDPTVMLRFIEQYRQEIETVRAMLPTGIRSRGRGNVTAVITGCLIRAAGHVPLPVIERFIQVLVTGEAANAGERGALLLRDYVMSSDRKRDRTIEYQKTQRAIQAFTDADPIERLLGQPDDLFPLSDVKNPKHTLRQEAARNRKRSAEERKVGKRRYVRKVKADARGTE